MKEETFTVYKVVRVVMGDFVSSTTGHPLFPGTKAWELRYILGEETVAHEGSVGILCFVESWASIRFVLDNSTSGYELAIVECVTKHVPHRQHLVINNTNRFEELVTSHGEWPGSRGHTGIGPAPAGTYVVPSLTPRRIYKEDTHD